MECLLQRAVKQTHGQTQQNILRGETEEETLMSSHKVTCLYREDGSFLKPETPLSGAICEASGTTRNVSPSPPPPPTLVTVYSLK